MLYLYYTTTCRIGHLVVTYLRNGDFQPRPREVRVNMKVLEYLEERRVEIACIPGCGQCCYNSCFNKDKVRKICAVHPSIIGVEKARKSRSYLCDLDPVGVSLELSLACPPVADVIERLTGERPLEDASMFERDGIVLFIRDSLERLLQREAGSPVEMNLATNH
jgi:hypothetical protein